MLKRILASLAIVSLLASLVIAIFWWRSYRHVDHFGYGNVNSTRTEFASRDGRIMVTTSENISGMIVARSEFYPHSRIAVGCLTIPILWLVIKIRSKLPRPGRLTPDDLRRRAERKSVN